jgi:uncharacterized protein involved in exopolysaccharide biosynthesis
MNEATNEKYQPVIDPQKLIGFIERQWLPIACLGLISAILVGLLSTALPKSYTAHAVVVSARVTYPVSFGTAIDTQTEDEYYSDIDRYARLSSYVQMVKNPAVAEIILGEVGPQLDEGMRDASSLLEQVEGELIANADAIQIEVTLSDPEMAATVANLWAAAYVNYVNDIYAGAGDTNTFNVIKLQTAEAKQAYETAQSALEAYIQGNQVAALTRQIDETEQMIANLVTVREQVLTSALENQSGAPLFVFEQEFEDLKTQLNQAYVDKRLADRLLGDAVNMRSQLASGGEGAASSNTLALEMLKVQVFTASEALGNLIIQTEPVTLTLDAMLQDLDGLVLALESQYATLDEKITALETQLESIQAETEGESAMDTQAAASVQSVLELEGLEEVFALNIENSPHENKIQEYEQAVRDLEAARESEQSTYDQLVHDRDIARSSYNTLAVKEAELAIAAQTKGAQVAFGTPASIPLQDDVSGVMNALLGGIAGVLVGTLLAIVLEVWWYYKGIEPRPLYKLFSLKRGQKRAM